MRRARARPRAELAAAGQQPSLPGCEGAGAPGPQPPAPGQAPQAEPGRGRDPAPPPAAAWARLAAEREALRLHCRRAGQDKARLLASLGRLRKHCALVCRRLDLRPGAVL